MLYLRYVLSKPQDTISQSTSYKFLLERASLQVVRSSFKVEFRTVIFVDEIVVSFLA